MTAPEVNDADDLLRSYLRAGDDRDEEKVRDLLADDVVTHSPGGLETLGVDAHMRAWSAAHDGLGELSHEVRDVVAAGALVAARVRVTGVHRGRFLGIEPTRARIEVDQALFLRVVAGSIVEVWEVVDTGLALRQLGVIGEQALSLGEAPA